MSILFRVLKNKEKHFGCNLIEGVLNKSKTRMIKTQLLPWKKNFCDTRNSNLTFANNGTKHFFWRRINYDLRNRKKKKKNSLFQYFARMSICKQMKIEYSTRINFERECFFN